MKKRYEQLTLAPFCYSVPSIGQTCRAVIILFIPQLVMLFLTGSYSSLRLIGVSLSACIVADIFDTYARNLSYKLSSSVFLQSLLIGMFIPSTYPPFKAFVIILITLLLCKYAFGGFAQAWANPAAVTVIMLYFFGNGFFPHPLTDTLAAGSSDMFTSLLRAGQIPINRFDNVIRSFLNTKILHYAGIVLPEGYVSLIWDTGSVIPALRFNLLTLVSTIYLISFNLIGWVIPAFYIATYSILVRFFGPVAIHGVMEQGDVLLALCTSGTLVGAFFILPWPGTVPMSGPGKIIYAVLAGVTAFLLNGCGTANIGTMFVILIMNIISPFIQYVEDCIYLFMSDKRRKVEE